MANKLVMGIKWKRLITNDQIVVSLTDSLKTCVVGKIKYDYKGRLAFVSCRNS